MIQVHAVANSGPGAAHTILLLVAPVSIMRVGWAGWASAGHQGAEGKVLTAGCAMPRVCTAPTFDSSTLLVKDNKSRACEGDHIKTHPHQPTPLSILRCIYVPRESPGLQLQGS